MDAANVDKVLQYALAVAQEAEEFTFRSLGPIQLIKYAYLGDLAFAQANDGRSFTGCDWTFHHYGPWAAEVYKRIEPALACVGADRRTFESKFSDDDCVRWSLSGVASEKLARELPDCVARRVKREVRRHGNDTYGLLDAVYKTEPMLRAAPGEVLLLRSPLAPEERAEQHVRSPEFRVSNSKRKKILAKLEEKRKQRTGGVKPAAVQPQPRYDEVYTKGVAWLDSLAGTPISEETGILNIDDSVFKSPGRSEDYDVS